MSTPTDLPHGSRRTVRVVSPAIPPSRPTTVPAVLLAAARVIQSNGLWQGDWVPDPFNREMCIPHFLRPMSIVTAIKYAATGDPHVYVSRVADDAIAALALAIGDGPDYGDIFSLEEHIEDWGDEPGRSVDEAVALLEWVATSPAERAA
ncbi:hypothetical protein [Streptomyces subrutilus]|uniref:DUF6197 family protein n=1 Tax=Streptomyces subrutilus TaxID=36818 RepID=UPI002E0F48B9|nr:hypothetical protein OG479_32695 [Streptomyces subrutilus]